jgi:hypothetical protein
MTPINDGEKDVVPMRIPFIPMRILFSRFASAGRVGSAGKKWEPLKPVLVFLLMMRLNVPFKTFFSELTPGFLLTDGSFRCGIMFGV